MESTPGAHDATIDLAQRLQNIQIHGNVSILVSNALLTISMDESAYDYNILGDDLDPDELYQEVLQSIAQVHQPAYSEAESLNPTSHARKALARMVHSSNFIERAGASDLATTERICALVLRQPPTPWTYPAVLWRKLEPAESVLVHSSLVNDLTQRGQSADHLDIVRAYKEVVHHVAAAFYIFQEVVIKGMPLTEDIILETHRILTYGIDIPPSNTSLTSTSQGWQREQDQGTYSGIYRRVPVSAGMHGFPPAEDVPILMRRFIASLDHDIVKAKNRGSIDPIALAAKYCHMFVNIHPFLDGNGRMCRLILNALLLKYGGGKIPIVAFGGTEEEREEYLRIAANASMREGMREDDGEDHEEGKREGICYDGLKRKEFKELASYVLKHVVGV